MWEFVRVFATAGRAIGPRLLVLACLGLTACETTYEDTKGWANRLEASFLKEMERTFEQADPEPGPQRSGPRWEEEDGRDDRRASPAAGIVSESAAKMVEAHPSEGAGEAKAGKTMKPAAPQEAVNPGDDPTGPAPTIQASEAAVQDRSAKEMDPTGPAAAATKPEVPPRPKLKPSGAMKKSDTETAAAPAGTVPQKTQAKTALVIHLSSLRSESAAKREWQALQKAFPDQLSTMSPRFRRTEIADRGTFYRVLAGPVTSKQAARQICSALKAKKQYCQVMTAPPAA